MQSFTIQVSGDEGQSFACADDDAILRAALRSCIGLSYECNSGGCGLCQFELVDGEIRELWPEAPGLSPRAGEHGRDIVCVASGSGLSPVLSILAAAVRAPKLSVRDLHLFYGGRGPQDICVHQIIAADPLLSERVTLHTAMSDENAPGGDRWEGERGFVHELVERTLGERIACFDFYFCGPPPMMDAVQRRLMFGYQVPASQLFFDRFF